MYMSTGSKIRAYRRKTGMTCSDLAGMIGITPATVSRYESGKIELISNKMLKKTADVLDCTVEDLTSDDPACVDQNYYSRTKEEKELLRGYYGLSPKLQEPVRLICSTGISHKSIEKDWKAV